MSMSGYQKAYRLSRHGQNLFKVSASVGGIENSGFVRVSLLLDTGASFTILPAQPLNELGYDLQNPLRRQEIITGKGKISAPVISLSWFNCVGQKIDNFEVVAYDIPPNLLVNGLLGMDFLCQCQAIISIGEAEIRCRQF